MESRLDIKDLSVTFEIDEGPLKAVDGVSFSVGAGEVVGLVGESGCGKSVTALSLLRLIPMPPGKIVSGEVLFEGQDLLRLPTSELQKIRGRKISMIFQEPTAALSPLHRVGAHLIETLQLHKEALGATAHPADPYQTCLEWLTRVGIPDPAERMKAYPFELSGGMLQRIMIAMALMLEPSLIIADEPTTALDVTIQAQILDQLRAMKGRDTSLLLITHDLGVVWEMCDRVVVMYAGRIVEEGSRHELFETPSHPYSQALLESVLSLNSQAERLATIDGQIPSPMAYPAGCRFADRCKHAFERCRREQPPLYDVSQGHHSACFLSDTSPHSLHRSH